MRKPSKHGPVTKAQLTYFSYLLSNEVSQERRGCRLKTRNRADLSSFLPLGEKVAPLKFMVYQKVVLFDRKVAPDRYPIQALFGQPLFRHYLHMSIVHTGGEIMFRVKFLEKN